jgi:phosphoglycerate dehydrogenase-like enzyme
MKRKVGYLMKADDEVYGVVRRAFDPAFELVTDPGRISELDVVIAGKVSRAMIESAPDLGLILAPGIGVDGIDLAAAAERKIPVACTVCGNVTEVAEHAMLLMLAVSRRLTELDAALRRGEWLMWGRRLQCRNLFGRTLGIVGYGRIGREIATRAAAFGMIIQVCDPSVPAGLSLESLLATSDYVCLCVPLNTTTRGFIGAEAMAEMKPGSILINVARGEIVDETALIEALRSGQLSGAGLDVFAIEPPSAENPLLSMPNVVVTPHVGSGTLDGLQAKAAQYAENVRRHYAGEPLIDCVQSAAVEAAAR